MNESELEVRNWLSDVVKLQQYADIIIDDGFDDMETVMTLTDDDLIKIGIEKRGHRRKISLFIDKRKQQQHVNRRQFDI